MSVINFKVNDYNELKKKLIEYNHDCNTIEFDCYYKNSKVLENVYVKNEILYFCSDNKKVDYSNIKFEIVIDSDSNNNIENNKEIILSTSNLSTSRKIQYILLKKKLLTSLEIYEEGKPWNCKGKTPKNTVIARCSTLYKNGYIKKINNKYFIDI